MGAIHVAVFAAMACLLAACGGSENIMPEGKFQDYSPEAYTIGVGDQIKIEVWGNEKLSLQVPVRPDGKVSMSLVGDILAAGKTAEDLSAHIAERLLAYIKNPQVTVIIANPSSADFQHRVRVTGAVKSPKSIPFRKGMTVMDLVLISGGLNEFAQANKAKLYRRVDDKVQVYTIYLDDILREGVLETNYSLVPSDIITIPERSF
jgi:polysaccharide export outer membrane protein